MAANYRSLQSQSHPENLYIWLIMLLKETNHFLKYQRFNCVEKENFKRLIIHLKTKKF